MAETINDRAGQDDGQGGRRQRQEVKRSHRVEFSLTGKEFQVLEAAAGRAGLARGAYAAEVALAAARGEQVATDSPFPELLRELIRASGLVRRIGVNLNQAVAKLNATGQRSADLLPYAAESLRRGGTPGRGGGTSPEGAAVTSGTDSAGPRGIPAARPVFR